MNEGLAIEVCRDDATILIANMTIKFMLDKLKAQSSDINLKLYDNLKLRTDKRTNTYVLNLLYSFHDPEKPLNKSHNSVCCG